MSESAVTDPASSILLLGLRGRKVVGLLWAERVFAKTNAKLANGAERPAAVLEVRDPKDPEMVISREERPVVLGIRLIWVRRTEQRRGLASALVDAARQQSPSAAAAWGKNISKVPLDEVAFSDPTGQGLAFAARYLQASRGGKVFVYQPAWG